MLEYSVQVTIYWALFAFLYSQLLRGETFFRANRLFLLGALALGLVSPVVQPLFPAVPNQVSLVRLREITVRLEPMAGSFQAWPVWKAVWWIYFTGVALQALRLCWGLMRLTALIRKNSAKQLPGGFRLVRTPATDQPFSFFHWIFVPTDFEEKTYSGQNMLAHEQAHARGGHSVDVLLLEILLVVAWFHPLVYWYRRALRTVHEYLADASASGQSTRREYGLLLLQQARFSCSVPIANHFFQNALKQRLLMLAKRSSARGRRWKYILALPLAALVWACTSTEISEEPNTKKVKNGAALELFEVEKIPEFPGGEAALIRYLSAEIKYPEAAKRAGAEGLTAVKITIDETGRVSKVEPAVNVSPDNAKVNRNADLMAEAIRVVSNMPAWNPARKNGQSVSCVLTLPIRFALE